MPWQPGQTGNAGGRPKNAVIGAAQALARMRLNRYVGILDKIAHKSTAENKDRIAAIKLLVQIAGIPLNAAPTDADAAARLPPPPVIDAAGIRASLGAMEQ